MISEEASLQDSRWWMSSCEIMSHEKQMADVAAASQLNNRKMALTGTEKTVESIKVKKSRAEKLSVSL